MSAATITQAQDKGLRHQLEAMAQAVQDFCRKLYAAHGGSTGPSRQAGEKRMSASELMELADRFEAYSPNLSAEIRSLASRA